METSNVHENTLASACSVRGVGLQYHLETTRESAQALIAHGHDELVDAPTIQTAEDMLSDDARFVDANHVMNRLLDAMATLGAGPGRG